jgi:hypothetical protein
MACARERTAVLAALPTCVASVVSGVADEVLAAAKKIDRSVKG